MLENYYLGTVGGVLGSSLLHYLLVIRQFIYLFFKKMVRLVSESKSSVYQWTETLLLCEVYLHESEIKVVH